MDLWCKRALGGITRDIPCFQVYDKCGRASNSEIRQELKRRGFPTEMKPHMISRGVMVPPNLKEELRKCDVKGVNAVIF